MTTPQQSRRRWRRGTRKRSKTRSPSGEYAARNSAAPTNGACTHRESRWRKCPWSKFFASATRTANLYPDLGLPSTVRGRFQACAFWISRACSRDRPARALWRSTAPRCCTCEVPSCLRSSRSSSTPTPASVRATSISIASRTSTSLRALVRDAHVFSQGYRPGALARRGFSPKEMAADAAWYHRGLD